MSAIICSFEAKSERINEVYRASDVAAFQYIVSTCNWHRLLFDMLKGFCRCIKLWVKSLYIFRPLACMSIVQATIWVSKWIKFYTKNSHLEKPVNISVLSSVPKILKLLFNTCRHSCDPHITSCHYTYFPQNTLDNLNSRRSRSTTTRIAKAVQSFGKWGCHRFQYCNLQLN
jgi:hypothetical protein